MGLGRDGILHGTCESRSCLFPLGRPVSRKACKTKTNRISSHALLAGFVLLRHSVKFLSSSIARRCLFYFEDRRPKHCSNYGGPLGTWKVTLFTSNRHLVTVDRHLRNCRSTISNCRSTLNNCRSTLSNCRSTLTNCR